MPRAAREMLIAGASLLCVLAGTEALALGTSPAWSYAAAALGCLHAGVLGAATVALGRRTTAAAWAPALLWPLAGAEPAAAALAALAGALLLGLRLRAPGRAVAGALAAGALAVLGGTAAATAAEPAAPHPAAQVRTADVAREGVGKARAARARDAARSEGGRGVAEDPPPIEDGHGAAEDAPPGDAAGEAAPGDAVRAYYRALDARRFGAAWRFLAPGVRTAFGGFAPWRAGFAATRSSRPVAMQVAVVGDRATVAHVLAAVDATACGSRTRRFALTWTLDRAPGGAWRATAVTGRALGAAPPPCG